MIAARSAVAPWRALRVIAHYKPEMIKGLISDSNSYPIRRNTMKYICSVCGYEYDPNLGDPDNDIPPGTAFEDLPEDWTCPVCDADKSDFEPDA